MTEMVELENVEFNTSVDLRRYEQLYENFDPGHDSRHLEEVRDFSLQLSEIHCPELKEVVYVSATLYDIGLSVERRDHERHGLELVLDDDGLCNNFSQEELQYILEGIIRT